MSHSPFTLDFTNKIALVTGATHGIGLQLAQDLIKSGAQVIGTTTSLEKNADTIVALGQQAKFIEVDFLNPTSFEQFLQTLDQLPRLDICINNAGIIKHQKIEQVTVKDWDDIQTVNIKAPYFIIKTVIAKMKAVQYGRIVNIGSIWGHNSMPERSVYTSSKYSLRGITNALAAEFSTANILVNAVAPAFTLTSMAKDNYNQQQLDQLAAKIPLGRLAQPEEVSKATLFLASDLNTYITGQSLIIDGGYTSV